MKTNLEMERLAKEILAGIMPQLHQRFEAFVAELAVIVVKMLDESERETIQACARIARAMNAEDVAAKIEEFASEDLP